jgi:hypothetical protein
VNANSVLEMANGVLRSSLFPAIDQKKTWLFLVRIWVAGFIAGNVIGEKCHIVDLFSKGLSNIRPEQMAER